MKTLIDAKLGIGVKIALIPSHSNRFAHRDHCRAPSSQTGLLDYYSLTFPTFLATLMNIKT